MDSQSGPKNGFTAQLNRADTLPHRDSPGQVILPGLTALTSAKDFGARLDLYHGSFLEHGNGLTLTAFVQPDTDTFVVDVTGAEPNLQQTAVLRLWEPRTPRATASNKVGMLAQTWLDHYGPGASGRTFGALAAITAMGRGVSAKITDPRTVTISFRPLADGHFRVIVACPQYSGASQNVSRALTNVDPRRHATWWQAFWSRAALIKLASADGSGEYMENLRTLYLYSAAAESLGRFPGSQAGIADLFSAVGDTHHWDPAAYWHWNLRMQVAANLSAGLSELNESYFRLYRDNLRNIERWTQQHMEGRPGICIPETMRFNGAGYEYEADWDHSKPPAVALNCDAHSLPYYNARTISTGAEVSLWMWRSYLATGNRALLAANYPVMAASARFLLAYESAGADGKRHTQPSNAHEQQWDTTDPTTDLAARRALFPAVASAAKVLGLRDPLRDKLEAEMDRIPAWPRKQVGADKVIAASYDLSAAEHNEENVGLEPVWPYGLIGDDSPDRALGRATFARRPYPIHQDWCFDPVQAARLGLPQELRSTLIALTSRYQTYINGFANWGGPPGEFYIEQQAVVALALSEALVQDYDGVIRIAPAVPPEWDFAGSVWVRHQTRVDVQVHQGVATTVVIEAGENATLSIRNPWPAEAVEVVDSRGAIVVTAPARSLVELHARKHETYLLRPAGAPAAIFAQLTAEPASRRKALGAVQIGN